MSHERQESSCFHIKSREEQLLPSHRPRCLICYTVMIQCDFSVSGQQQRWIMGRLWGDDIHTKACSHSPRLYGWRSPNVCTIGGQYVITATGRPNAGHSFCAILNWIWLKKIIFEPYWHGRVVSYERMVSTALLYVFNQALCNLYPTSIAHSSKQVPARLFLCLYSSEPKNQLVRTSMFCPCEAFSPFLKFSMWWMSQRHIVYQIS